MKKMDVKTMVLCALFAALSAVLSQISVPIGPVPINLAHVSVLLAAGLLGAGYGAMSQAVFVLMGAVGAPVFSGFRGGLAVLVGPTGGFLVGYIACAFVTGLLIDRFGRSVKVLIPAMYAGWIATYVPGVVWFMFVMEASLSAALAACVLPFLVGDALKTLLCALLITRLFHWKR